LITELKNSDWVRKGLEFIPENNGDQPSICPFCQEKTLTSHLVKQIENYFDKSYDDSVNMISNFLERYISGANKLLSLDSYKTNPFVDNHLSKLTLQHRNLEKSLSNNISAIRKKSDTPSIQVSLIETDKYISEFNAIIELINIDISNHNKRLDNIDNELDSLKKEFWELMRWENDQTIASYLSDETNSKKAISEGTDRKDIALKSAKEKRDEIAELQKSTVNIKEAVTNINDGLINLGITDFSIKKHSDALYRVVRTGNSDAVFSSLSEGEKMIISFLYFCELCRGKRSASETPTKKIAIIDVIKNLIPPQNPGIYLPGPI
jgi:wobble nucleotide-excising tRNase